MNDAFSWAFGLQDLAAFGAYITVVLRKTGLAAAEPRLFLGVVTAMLREKPASLRLAKAFSMPVLMKASFQRPAIKKASQLRCGAFS